MQGMSHGLFCSYRRSRQSHRHQENQTRARAHTQEANDAFRYCSWLNVCTFSKLRRKESMTYEQRIEKQNRGMDGAGAEDF